MPKFELNSSDNSLSITLTGKEPVSELNQLIPAIKKIRQENQQKPLSKVFLNHSVKFNILNQNDYYKQALSALLAQLNTMRISFIFKNPINAVIFGALQ